MSREIFLTIKDIDDRYEVTVREKLYMLKRALPESKDEQAKAMASELGGLMADAIEYHFKKMAK